MTGERVLVTGVGVVSSLGLDTETHFRGLLAGRSGVRAAPPPPLDGLGRLPEARVDGFRPHEHLDHRMLRKILPSGAAFAVVAARRALTDGGLLGDLERLRGAGLYVGSAHLEADFDAFVPALRESLDDAGRFDPRRFARRGMGALDPLFLVKALPNAGLGGISMHDNVTGPTLNLTNGQASGLQAVALAADAVRRGDAAVALAGGYDCMPQIENLAELQLQGRLAAGTDRPERVCRPFDDERCGTVVGEGAAFVLLEAERHARARGVSAYAELLPAAHTTAYGDPSSVHDAGALAEAVQRALGFAGCRADDVDAVFLDGLGTRDDDAREAMAARKALGSALPTFTAATPAIGFTGAATGCFSLAHAALSLRDDVVPPLLNCENPDVRCALTFAGPACRARLRRVLVWTSDRGLKNVAMLVTRHEASRPGRR